MSGPEPVGIRSTSLLFTLEEQAHFAGLEAKLHWLLEEAGELTPAELGLPSEEAKTEVLQAGWDWARSVGDILEHVIANRRAVG